MRAPAQLIETATVNTTGETVRVLRRIGVRHDEQIMHALELAGHFVIGTPGGFRYRRDGKRKFTRPAADSVFVIDGTGKAVATLPGPYFAQHYTVIQV